MDAAGHRTSVADLSGRTVNYGYDNLYRLTNEMIAADPAGMNGAVSFSYDAVGNRTQKVSTLPGYPGGLSNYNANDQLATDAYDAEGNTVGSGTNTGGNGYVYDFENQLIQQGGNTYSYDGDGNRVQKFVAGVYTNYLVDPLNPTGYAQVLTENYYNGTGPGEVAHRYLYGLERLSEVRDSIPGNRQYIFYVYDGHGSVRALTDQSGTVTDTYDYDAFGTLLHSTGTTYNNYLFAGEQFDPDLGLYYNRARYLNTSTGRFWSMDTDEGEDETPLSLHKYLYSEGDPINNADPSGNEIDEIAAGAMSETLDSIPSLNFATAVKQASDSLQLCCRSDVIDAMKKIWTESGNGQTGSEASFTVNGTLGNYTIQMQHYTNERNKQQLTISPGITFALFHVHPNSGGPKPSTPGNNFEGNKYGDTGNADRFKYDVYVVSSRGLWMYSWEQKRDIQFREGLDWTKPCSEKPLLPPKWVNP